MKAKAGKADVAFNLFNYTLLTLVLLIMAYPLYFVVIASISDPSLVGAGKVLFYPKGITMEGYKRVFEDPNIQGGFLNSFFYTFLGTFINIAVTLPAAYSLSRNDLRHRNPIMFFFTLTMFISGGLVPTYLAIQKLHMLDTVWALVIPGALSVYNMIIARTFFVSNIPVELLEAAKMDGYGNLRFFVSIVLPLSKAIIAILVLYYGVGHWNSYFSAMIYLNDRKLYPLQIILRDILIQNQMNFGMIKDEEILAQKQNAAELIKYALVIISSIPVLLL